MHFYYLNGQFLPSENALISVNERGFRFGDGVFETIPVHAGIPYLWEAHMDRLEAGLRALRIPLTTAGLWEIALTLIGKNSVNRGLLRLSVSRGGGSRGYLPIPGTAPTLVMQMLDTPPPVNALTLWHSSYEKISARALPVHCKLAQGINQTLARLEAEDNGCHEALQLNADSHIAEASAASIFWLKHDTLHTPALACGILAGVTRQRLIALSPYAVREGAYTLEDLRHAEAVILANAARGIMAVGGLKPQGYSWQSETLAQRMQALRARDILHYAARHRQPPA